jgi:hypothetical protein
MPNNKLIVPNETVVKTSKREKSESKKNSIGNPGEPKLIMNVIVLL